MKTKLLCLLSTFQWHAVVLGVGGYFLLSTSVFPQGSLTPPGPPAPTMKTLDQVEARTLIKALPYTISAEGSYYVTASLTTTPSSDGITVNASNVAIDLNGFEVIGNGGTKSGVFLNGGVTNVSIRNGTIRNWGGNAINGAGNISVRVVDVTALSITGSGAFYLDQKASVIRCVSDGNVGVGINVLAHSVVRDCQVIGTTGSPGDGISLPGGEADCTISGCVISLNSGHGITGGSDGTIENCTANSNTLNGINLGTGWSISHCSANRNSATGIVTGNSIISDCTAEGNTSGGAGFDIGSQSRITNSVSNGNNGAGIVASVQSTIKQCSANGNNGVGINTAAQGTVKQCSVNNNHGDGILAASSCVIAENHCESNGTSGTDAGIHATSTFNRIDGNVLTSNTTRALKVDSTNNVIIRNFAIGSATAYDIASSNEVGKIVVPFPSAAISGSSGGGLTPNTPPEPDSFTNFAN
jgi:parallel beta-helix repeat protein